MIEVKFEMKTIRFGDCIGTNENDGQKLPLTASSRSSRGCLCNENTKSASYSAQHMKIHGLEKRNDIIKETEIHSELYQANNANTEQPAELCATEAACEGAMEQHRMIRLSM